MRGIANQAANRWSSRVAFYLAAVGAAVGLGSIWRFPYLAGSNGGLVFIVAFLLASVLIAVPLLVAEFMLGRWSRRSPADAAGEVAVQYGSTRAWNVIGWLATLAALLIFSYYSMLAGWVLAYTWKCATGSLSGKSPPEITRQFQHFLADPVGMLAWQVLFMALVVTISIRGLNRGIEIANKIRAPGLLLLLLVLVGYSLTTGDVARGLSFAFVPDWSKLSGATVLAAIGQAFFATGVGMALMIACGAYAPEDAPLVRSSLITTGAIIVVSLLSTLFVFPLVFRYHMNPAQGSELVFNVLPIVFSQMPGGRLIGTLFFVLLILAALTPSVAITEVFVGWLEQRSVRRPVAVVATALATVLVGLGSITSFNVGASWRPLHSVPILSELNFFSLIDFVSANFFLPFGALLTSVFVGWFVLPKAPSHELPSGSPVLLATLRVLLRYVCPLAILAVIIAALR